jgi:uncharacterized protein (TIRG00374 family)
MTEGTVAEPRLGAGRWGRGLGLLISAVALGAVVWWASTQEPPDLPSEPGQLLALAGAIALYGVATLLRGERWWRLLRAGGATPSRTDAYSLTAVGYMGNAVLPARAGDAMRVVLQAPRAETSVRQVIGTLVAERVLDAATLLSIFALLAYVLLRGIDTPDTQWLLVAIAALGIAAVAWLVVHRLVGEHQLVAGIRRFLAPMASATRDLRGRHGAAMLLFTAGIWAVEASVYLLAGVSVGLDMTAVEALYVVSLASVIVLVPAGPGYLGTLDAAILFGTRAIGASGEVAFSYLLVMRFVLVVPITLAGLGLFVARYGGLRRSPRPTAEGS